MLALTICSPELGISPESNSGGEVYDREVLWHLAKKGIKVLTLLPKNRPFPRHEKLLVEYAPIKPIFPPYLFNFFVFLYLLKTIKERPFDILRVHSPYFVGPAAILFKKLYPKIPVVASYLHLEENSVLQPLLDKIIINRFDHIITISQFSKKEIIKRYGLSPAKISVAYPGIEVKFQPQRKSQQLCRKYKLENKKGLLFLGGLKKRKNPLFLLEVFKNIKDKQAVLVVAGEGPSKKKMLSETKRLGIENRVVFVGFVDEAEKVKFYNLADIVLLPSLKEGFGMIAAEAAACGKIVIASNNSSLPEVIADKKTGFLAETNNINDWVSKIKILLKSKSLRREIDAQAQKYVRQKFSWNKNAEKHIQVFEKLLNRK